MPPPPSTYRKGISSSSSGGGEYDENGYRKSDGAKKIVGYSREKQPPVRGSGLDEFYARQRGAPSERDNPAFKGATAEDIARDLNAQGMRTGFGGKEVEPDRNLSPRERAMLPPSKAPSPAAPPPPPPSTDPANMGLGAAMDSTASNASLRQSIVSGAGKPTPAPPVDPSTVRQPMAPVSDGMGARDAAGNPASSYNPAVGTPAEFRQMAADAQVGRTVTTAGATGLNPSTTGGRPMQAGDFRRSISSKYGTGSNVTRQPGQAPGGTMRDIAGRTVPMRQGLQDQSAVQATKFGPGAQQAGQGFFNPADIRKSVASSIKTSEEKDESEET